MDQVVKEELDFKKTWPTVRIDLLTRIAANKPQRLHKEGITRQYTKAFYTDENFNSANRCMQPCLAKGQHCPYQYPDQGDTIPPVLPRIQPVHHWTQHVRIEQLFQRDQ